MGFLDDLKRQAEALQARQSTDTAALERNTALADVACKGVLTYLDTLARQLIVLEPQSKVLRPTTASCRRCATRCVPTSWSACA